MIKTAEEIRKQFKLETGKDWITIPVSHGELGFASWEYQLWLEYKVAQFTQPQKVEVGEAAPLPIQTGEPFILREFDSNKWYWCKCENCGWEDSSEFCEGGHAIADTGDYSDPICPICFSNKIEGEWTVEVPEERGLHKIKIPVELYLAPYKKQLEYLRKVEDELRYGQSPTGDVRKVDSGNVFIEREIKSYGLPKKTGKYIYKDKWGNFGECVYAYPPSTINESWDSKYPISWLEPLPQGEGYSVEDCQCENKGDFTLVAGYSYCNKCGKRC